MRHWHVAEATHEQLRAACACITMRGGLAYAAHKVSASGCATVPARSCQCMRLELAPPDGRSLRRHSDAISVNSMAVARCARAREYVGLACTHPVCSRHWQRAATTTGRSGCAQRQAHDGYSIRDVLSTTNDECARGSGSRHKGGGSSLRQRVPAGQRCPHTIEPAFAAQFVLRLAVMCDVAVAGMGLSPLSCTYVSGYGTRKSEARVRWAVAWLLWFAHVAVRASFRSHRCSHVDGSGAIHTAVADDTCQWPLPASAGVLTVGCAAVRPAAGQPQRHALVEATVEAYPPCH